MLWTATLLRAPSARRGPARPRRRALQRRLCRTQKACATSCIQRRLEARRPPVSSPVRWRHQLHIMRLAALQQRNLLLHLPLPLRLALQSRQPIISPMQLSCHPMRLLQLMILILINRRLHGSLMQIPKYINSKINRANMIQLSTVFITNFVSKQINTVYINYIRTRIHCFSTPLALSPSYLYTLQILKCLFRLKTSVPFNSISSARICGIKKYLPISLPKHDYNRNHCCLRSAPHLLCNIYVFSFVFFKAHYIANVDRW